MSLDTTKSRSSSVGTVTRSTKAGEKNDSEVDKPEKVDKSKKSKDKRSTKSAEDPEKQPTIDKHLQVSDKPKDSKDSGDSGEPKDPKDKNLEEMIENFTRKLDGLASRSYIDEKFGKMISAETFNSKVNELESKIKTHLKTELEKINTNADLLNGRVKTTEGDIETLKSDISDMKIKLAALEKTNGEVKKDNEDMKALLGERELVLRNQSIEINNLEQYTRRNSIRIYGIKDRKEKESATETAIEVVKLIRDKLSLKISTADIDIAHRIGKFQTDGDRPIICKFISRFTKYEVITIRSRLKKSGCVIREDLTWKNAKLLEKTSACDRVKNAWSHEGRIIALLDDDTKIVVDAKTNLKDLGGTE